MDSIDARVLAAAAWLRSDDTAYEAAPDMALRAARGMLAAADAVDPLRSPLILPSSIEQHIPESIETDDPPIIAQFITLAELVAIPFVANFQAEPNFFRFSIEKYGIHALLMAEFDTGRRWLVVGLITGPQPDLPAWEPVRTTK